MKLKVVNVCNGVLLAIGDKDMNADAPDGFHIRVQMHYPNVEDDIDIGDVVEVSLSHQKPSAGASSQAVASGSAAPRPSDAPPPSPSTSASPSTPSGSSEP